MVSAVSPLPVTPPATAVLVSMRASQGLLQPTAGQAVRLTALLEAQRVLYNAALEERRGAWRWQRPGFPRFKNRTRFDSVEYSDRGGWRIAGNRLYLRGVGHIRFRTSRRGIRGTPKTLTVRREGNRWRFTVFCARVPETRLEPTGRQVGIDLGVTELVATSDGELVPNPRWLGRSLDRLARAQRVVARRQRGSVRRTKATARVGAMHRKLARQRRDGHHHLSRRLVDGSDLIAHEQLHITYMTRRPRPQPDQRGGHAPNGAAAKAGLNREILGAGWGQLLRMITYKAAEAGRTVIAVDPRDTSRTCHRCGHVDHHSRDGTAFVCTACGHTAHADVNAARNILRAGLAHRQQREAA